MSTLLPSDVTGFISHDKKGTYRKVVVFDLDDTLFSGEDELFRLIQLKLDRVGIVYEWKNRMSKTDPVVGKYLVEVLDDAGFMASTPIIKDRFYFGELLKDLQSEYPDVLFMFCTHRGYSPKAKRYTEKLFLDNQIVNFPGVYLDYNNVPCKVTFLNEFLEGVPYILFDDHPKYDGEGEGGVENVFLMDKSWNQEETQYKRLFSFISVIEEIDRFL